jgi:rhodanese-related sulfurtransferase
MMSNLTDIPEISVQETARKLRDGEIFIILDVREAWELERARLLVEQVIHSPMSQLARQGVYALPVEVEDKQQEIVVICHHGVRSAEVTAWLLRLGWQHVRSMAGGVEAYAALVDSSIGKY